VSIKCEIQLVKQVNIKWNQSIITHLLYINIITYTSSLCISAPTRSILRLYNTKWYKER